MSCLVQCCKNLGSVGQLACEVGLDPLPVVSEMAGMKEMLASFAEADGGSHLYVLDEAGTITGCIGRADILRYLFFFEHDPYSAPASLTQLAQAETAAGFLRPATTAAMIDDVVDVLERMIGAALQEIPVVGGDGRPKGLLSMTAMLSYYQTVQAGVGAVEKNGEALEGQEPGNRS